MPMALRMMASRAFYLHKVGVSVRVLAGLEASESVLALS